MSASDEFWFRFCFKRWAVIKPCHDARPAMAPTACQGMAMPKHAMACGGMPQHEFVIQFTDESEFIVANVPDIHKRLDPSRQYLQISDSYVDDSGATKVSGNSHTKASQAYPRRFGMHIGAKHSEIVLRSDMVPQKLPRYGLTPADIEHILNEPETPANMTW